MFKKKSFYIPSTRIVWRYFFLAFFVIFYPRISFAFPWDTSKEQFWNTPFEINDKNTNISFSLTSSLHKIDGAVLHSAGRCWLDDENDFTSIRAHISLPVMSLDTGNSGRDENMQRIMNATSHPEVLVNIHSARGLCSPHELSIKKECSGVLEGEISINGVEKNIEIEIQLQKKDEKIKVLGSTHLLWTDFDILDPSTLVSRLYPEVKINISMILP